MEAARSMMTHAGLPDKFWAEAVDTAAYLRNRTPTTAIRGYRTPYEVWYGERPNIGHLKVFGCVAYALIPDSAVAQFSANPSAAKRQRKETGGHGAGKFKRS